MTDRRLFEQNAYGDIWQEPELFDVKPAHVLGAPRITEDGADYLATADCSCGVSVTGRCCSAHSAKQWLATEHHRHVVLEECKAFELIDVPTIELTKSELLDRCFCPGQAEDIDKYLATFDF